jgi:hypothetical protein
MAFLLVEQDSVTQALTAFGRDIVALPSLSMVFRRIDKPLARYCQVDEDCA